jgi:hypothetical protein
MVGESQNYEPPLRAKSLKGSAVAFSRLPISVAL